MEKNTPKNNQGSKPASKGMSTEKKVLIGAGVATLAAAAAGAIFLYGTDAGKKKRKEIKSWSLKMQGEVIEKMESMKDWSETAYHAMIDSVGEKYKNLKKADPAEVALLVADLKKHWKNLKRHTEGAAPKKKTKASKPKEAKKDEPKI